MRLLSTSYLTGALLLGLVSLAGCYQQHRDPQGPTSPKGEIIPHTDTPREEAVGSLLYHISFAQGIEHGDLRGKIGPKDPISTVLPGSKYHIFPNVHALRLSIRQRWDSLRAAGVVLDYDTLYEHHRVVYGPAVRIK